MKRVFDEFPEPVRIKLLALRQLIIQCAEDSEEVGPLQETLKWHEPSYLNKSGSTIRLGWRARNPQYCAIYFNCQTSLVETFREIYGDEMTFEGNRAILVPLDGKVAEGMLAHCILLGLTYHKVKHLPLLGA